MVENVENVDTTTIGVIGMKPLTNYTLTIQSQNKYTYFSPVVEVSFITTGIIF